MTCFEKRASQAAKFMATKAVEAVPEVTKGVRRDFHMIKVDDKTKCCAPGKFAVSIRFVNFCGEGKRSRAVFADRVGQR